LVLATWIRGLTALAIFYHRFAVIGGPSRLLWFQGLTALATRQGPFGAEYTTALFIHRTERIPAAADGETETLIGEIIYKRPARLAAFKILAE
jgi:hypothetical protein